MQRRLKDLDFVDDIALLSQICHDMQQKTDDTADNAKLIRMEINVPKTKNIWMNCTSSEPIRLHGADIMTLTSSRNFRNGSCDDEVMTRLSKASQGFGMQHRTWRSERIGLKTKLRLFRSNVMSTLLYGSK